MTLTEFAGNSCVKLARGVVDRRFLRRDFQRIVNRVGFGRFTGQHFDLSLACQHSLRVQQGLQQLCVIYRRCSRPAGSPNRSHRRARHWHKPAPAAFAGVSRLDRLAGPPIRRPDSSGFVGLRLQLSRRTTDYVLRSRPGAAELSIGAPFSPLYGGVGVAPAADVPPNPVVVVFGVEQNQKPFRRRKACGLSACR